MLTSITTGGTYLHANFHRRQVCKRHFASGKLPQENSITPHVGCALVDVGKWTLQCYRTNTPTDWVAVLRPTRHKIGHFGDVSPSKSFGLVLKKKTKLNTTKASIRQSKEMYYNTKQTRKTKARFSRLLQHPAWKRSRSILKGKGKYCLLYTSPSPRD